MEEKEKSLDVIYTKIFGISYRQNLVEGMAEGDELILEREPSNEYDRNAIKVLRVDLQLLGYISRELAEKISPLMDSGVKFTCKVRHITGEMKNTRGVNIIIRKGG